MSKTKISFNRVKKMDERARKEFHDKNHEKFAKKFKNLENSK